MYQQGRTEVAYLGARRQTEGLAKLGKRPFFSLARFLVIPLALDLKVEYPELYPMVLSHQCDTLS